METLEEIKRHLGIRVPVTLDVITDLLGDAAKWVKDRISEPAIRMRQIRAKTEEMREFLAEDRSAATDRSVRKGRMLLDLRRDSGPSGWGEILRLLGMCRRTAQNLIALALFSRRAPGLFEKLKRLGSFFPHFPIRGLSQF